VYCWLNDGLCPLAEARVPVLDRGFLYGDTLFETLRFDAAGAHWLQRHLARLAGAAERLGFALPRPTGDLPAILAAVTAANGAAEGVLRITLSRGIGQRGANPAGAHSPTLLVTQSALPPDLDARRRRGYRLVLSPWRKPAPDMLPNWAKHGSYLNSVLAHAAAAAEGADEALLRAHDGGLAEASMGNVFVVRGERVLTPAADSGALLGVLRAVVLECAASSGLAAEEGRVDDACWQRADEIFLTNAVIGVMPVASVAGWGYPAPGARTARIAAAVAAAQRAEALRPAAVAVEGM
jgi:branched-chain amino acid aminotransferase